MKLTSNKEGIIALITGKYPHFSNRNIIPNSNYLIHSENENIQFNLYGNTLQFNEFININNGGTINYPNYDNEKLSDGNFEHNIIPNNKASFNYNGENSDILLRYRTSVNNELNIHYLDLKNDITLKYNPISPTLIYFKVPKEDYDNININFEKYEGLNYTDGYITQDELYKIINGNNVPTTNNSLTSTFKIPNYNEENEGKYYYMYINYTKDVPIPIPLEKLYKGYISEETKEQKQLNFNQNQIF